MHELEQYIKANYGIDNDDMAKIASRFELVEFNKGNYFLKTGRQSDRMAFIQSGLMRIYVQLDGREVTQWISTKGYFLTDLASFVFHTPARWNIQALTPCQMYVINRDAYNGLGKEIPRWNEIDKLFIARCFTILEDRIFSHLYMTAEERYHKLLEFQPDLFTQVPLQYLASILGMTPETLSRLRKKPLA